MSSITCMSRFTLVALFAATSALPAVADEVPKLLGADAVLKSANEALKTPADGQVDETATLQQRIDAFNKTKAKLSAKDAAAGWLEMYDFAVENEPYESLQSVIKALPQPSVWPALVKAIEARKLSDDASTQANAREHLLRLFAHTLTANRDAAKEDLIVVEGLVKDLTGYQKSNAEQMVLRLKQYGAEASDSKDDIVESLAQRIAAAKHSRQFGGLDSVRVPDLVTLVGRKKARELLGEALRQPVLITLTQGDDTAELARKLALDMVDQMQVPQWALVHSLDSTKLYEAIRDRFVEKPEPPKPVETNADVDPEAAAAFRAMIAAVGLGRRPSAEASEEPWALRSARQGAEAYYLLGLIVADRSDEAIAFLKQQVETNSDQAIDIPYGALEQLQDRGFSDHVYAFWHKVLSDDPTLPVWDPFIEAASHAGRKDEMLTLVAKAVQAGDGSIEQQQKLAKIQADALLAADLIDEAQEPLYRGLELGLSGKATEDMERTTREIARTLFDAGRFLGRDEWLQQSLKILLVDSKDEYHYRSDSDKVGVLMQLGRYAEAEQTLLKALKQAVAKQASDEFGYDNSAQRLLMRLALLYDKLDRHDDVLTLVREAKWWGATDLVAFLQSDRDLVLAVGRALFADGKQDAARKIAISLLFEDGGNDDVYKLLIAIDGAGAMPFLDRLYEYDKFEERPLIWKARLLLDSGKVDDAERIVKQAIAIDPSDGEQGKGDRMRAYAVLADIHRARGDLEKADFFDNIVRSIRKSENADDAYAAGLLSRGIKMYRDALDLFADAYCIQSRIARNLYKMGLVDEAGEHYRRAFELMPDSFGYMESHCFGCEGAFSGPLAQNIADEVFTKMAKEQPHKPQVFYLLGYLRQNQDRDEEALAMYRKAVDLDPNYINAWDKIESLSKAMRLPTKVHDDATFQIARLDPQRRHKHPDLGSVADFERLWAVVKEMSAHRIKPPDTLMQIGPDVAASDNSPAAQRQRMRMMEMVTYHSRGSTLTPESAIASHNVMQHIAAMHDRWE